MAAPSTNWKHDSFEANGICTEFNLIYPPIVDVTTESLLVSPEKQDGAPLSVRHTAVSPVAHIGGEQQPEEEAFIGAGTLKPLDDVDVPNWRTLSGTIIILIMSMMVTSVFICLVRSDFNFVFYLFGYYVWCIESRSHHTMEVVQPDVYPRTSDLRLASKSTIDAAKCYSILLAGATFVDISWFYLGGSVWLCGGGDSQSCWPGKEDGEVFRRIKLTYNLHRFAILVSLLNIVGKVGNIKTQFSSTTVLREHLVFNVSVDAPLPAFVHFFQGVVIILSIVWLIQQRECLFSNAQTASFLMGSSPLLRVLAN